MAVKFLLFSRWNNFICELPYQEATISEVINTQNRITMTCSYPLSKGDRLVWQDGDVWREHVVDEIVQEHTSGNNSFEIIAQPSYMTDLKLKFIKNREFEKSDIGYILKRLLEDTTWLAGDCEYFEPNDFSVNNTNTYDALLTLAGTFGAELQCDIEVNAYGVVSKTLRFVHQIGKNTDLRFDYQAGLYGVTKRVLSDDVYTRIYAYGSDYGEMNEYGESEAVTLWPIVGKAYIEDNQAIKFWGLPDGHGGMMHAEGYYSNSACRTPEQLYKEAVDYLNSHNAPQIEYELTLPFAGIKGARLGDTIQTTDIEFEPVMRLETRIGEMERNLVTGETTMVKMGTITSLLPDALARTLQYRNQFNVINGRLKTLEDYIRGS